MVFATRGSVGYGKALFPTLAHLLASPGRGSSQSMARPRASCGTYTPGNGLSASEQRPRPLRATGWPQTHS